MTDNTGGLGRSCEKTHISEDTQKLWKRAGGWLPVVVVSDVYERAVLDVAQREAARDVPVLVDVHVIGETCERDGRLCRTKIRCTQRRRFAQSGVEYGYIDKKERSGKGGDEDRNTGHK